MADDEVLGLSRVLHPGVPDDELPSIVMVGVYLDESDDGDGTGRGVFTLAGWLASNPTGWKDIIPAWQAMVDRAPHPITEFHMTDIAQRANEFSDDRGWTQPERDALVKQASDILCDTRLSGGLTAIGCSIIRSELQLKDSSAYELYQTAYEVLLLNLLTRFNAFRSFDLVFDCKEKVRKHVEAHFWSAKAAIDRIPHYRGMLKSVERLCERPHHFKVLDHRLLNDMRNQAGGLFLDVIPDDED